MFFSNEEKLSYEHLKHAWQLASTLKETTILEQFSFKIAKTALNLVFLLTIM